MNESKRSQLDLQKSFTSFEILNAQFRHNRTPKVKCNKRTHRHSSTM